MNDLARKYWLAKENRSRPLVVSMLAVGLAFIAFGVASHRDFVAGFGAGLIIVIAAVTVLALVAARKG